MADVHLARVVKVYGKQAPTIRDLSLHIEDGEFMVLVGPSGCGKSTTLRIIAGLEDASSGDVYIGDKRVNDVAPKDRDIAMVFQNYALYPHMNVRENMAFGLKLRKFPETEINARVREAAEMLEIPDLLERKPRELSGGQRQRVALGRAIVRKPTVFLFDEPLSNLDAKLRVQMRTEIKKLHKRLGTTMIYVTHDQVEAMTMGDRITVMKDGEIHQVDAPMALYEKPADTFVAGFIGSPGMNMLTLRPDADGSTLSNADGIALPLAHTQRVALADRSATDVILGIRPEHISINPGHGENVRPLTTSFELSELLGHETYLYLRSGDTRLTCRANTAPPATSGDAITVYLDMDKAHLFDAESGRRIF
ncbi:MAG: sn-glycerol-3-phosphate ABC transporter ATP-binding protein UgpC [Bacteroidia bacterium]|nr:sn-glycerol-3-phosphate ABC transporter ATP-binding protein UgpC [Bacteroidia bacterium]